MMEYHSETYCDICGDSFHTKEILADHKLEHTEESNADKVNSGSMHCNFCEKVFQSKSDLMGHK